MDRSRTGSMQDLVTILRVVPVLGLTLLAAGLLQSELAATSKLGGPALDSAGKALQIMDLAPIFLIIGLLVSAALLANQLGAHPVALGVSFLFLGVIVYVSAIYSNLWLAIINQPAFTAVANMVPFTHLVMEHFPVVIGVIGLVIIYVMYRLGNRSGRRSPL